MHTSAVILSRMCVYRVRIKCAVLNINNIYCTEYGLRKNTLYSSSKQNIRVSQHKFQHAHLMVHMSVLDPCPWQRLDIIL